MPCYSAHERTISEAGSRCITCLDFSASFERVSMFAHCATLMVYFA